jgi:hypothetical protein
MAGCAAAHPSALARIPRGSLLGKHYVICRSTGGVFTATTLGRDTQDPHDLMRNAPDAYVQILVPPKGDKK